MITDDLITDGGPIYAETTDLSSFIVEPWNSITSLAIVAPAIYWAIKLRGHDFKNYGFMWYCIPLLILGGLGSTLFHGLRNSEFFLYLDVLPTAILTLSVAIYFWIKILPKWGYTFVIFVPSFILRYMLFDWFSDHTAANIAYFITGTLIFLPILIYLHRINYFSARWILLSIFMLVVSLFFREIDTRGWFQFPMGTHFLWHIFSGIGAYYLAKFLFLLRSRELSPQI